MVPYRYIIKSLKITENKHSKLSIFYKGFNFFSDHASINICRIISNASVKAFREGKHTTKSIK